MKIIDECQRKGIGVVVTYLPFCATTDDKMAANAAGTIAARYGVPYLNMLNLGIIDIDSDLNDPGHLNITGAIKVTDSLGKWLMENGDLTDHRGDAAFGYYDESISLASRENVDFLLGQTSFYDDLEMLSLDDVSAVVYLNQGSGSFSDNEAKKLVSNISGTGKIYSVQGPYVLIKDLGDGKTIQGGSNVTAYEAEDEHSSNDGDVKIFEAGDSESLNDVATGLGNLVYQPVEQLFRFLYPKEDESINYLYDDDHIYDDIQIIIYDSKSGEILGRKYYKSYGCEYKED